jgi:4-amino-4-deoxy-L-arabinose transferase-like glycosyltransferase
MNALARLPRMQLLVLFSAIILIANLFANVLDLAGNDDADEGGVGDWLGISVFGIAVMALLLLVVVPRRRGSQRRTAARGFGIAAVVTLAVFWSSLPFAFAAAALSAAGPDEDSAQGEAPAPNTAAIILAALATVAAFVFCIIG